MPIKQTFTQQPDESVEFRLLLACISSETGAAGTSAIAAIPYILRNSIQWSLFIRLANEHKVVPVVYSRLKHVEALIPPDVSRELAQHAKYTQRKNTALTVDLARILYSFGSKNMPVLVIKGIPLALQIYGSLEFRQFSDIDLLCRREDVGQAIELLAGLGYKPKSVVNAVRLPKLGYHYQFYHPQHEVDVELHWKVFPLYLDFFPAFDEIWQRSITAKVFNKQIPTLSLEDTFLMLCIHGVKHHWTRLCWLYDIMRFMETHSELNWQFIFDQAIRRHCNRMVLLAIYLVNQVLGAPLRPDIEYQISRDNHLPQLSEQIRKLLHNPTDGYFENHVFQISARERLRDKYQYIRIKQPFLDDSISSADLAVAAGYYGYYYLLWINRVVRKYGFRPIAHYLRDRHKLAQSSFRP